MTDDPGHLPRLRSRRAYVDYLEGHSQMTEEGRLEGKPTPLRVKTYMLETARHSAATDHGFGFAGHVQLERLDDTMYRVEDKRTDDAIVGLLEVLNERHPVLYTTMKAAESQTWVRETIDVNPWLDRLWLSPPILFHLWQNVQANTPTHRFIRLVFEHEAKFQADESHPDDDFDSQDTFAERRRSRVNVTESVSFLKDKLGDLMKLYHPLHSLVQLQMPGMDKGGHNLYFDVRATNLTDSFAEHRATISSIIDRYHRVTELAEDRLWVHFVGRQSKGRSHYRCPTND